MNDELELEIKKDSEHWPEEPFSVSERKKIKKKALKVIKIRFRDIKRKTNANIRQVR